MKYFSEVGCVFVDLVTRKKHEEESVDAGVMTLWSEVFDTEHPEEVLEIFKKHLPNLDFQKSHGMYMSVESYRLKDFPFFDLTEKSYLQTFDNSQPNPYIKIMVRTGKFLRDNQRLC